MSPDVSVPRRMLPTASNVDGRALRAQIVEQQTGGLGCVGHQVPAGVLFPLGACSENKLFLLRVPALSSSRTRPSRARGLQLLDRLDPELCVEQGNRLRADALEVEQVENRRRELLEQVAVKTSFACLGNLADFRRQVLADAGYGAQLVFTSDGRVFRSRALSFQTRSGMRES